MQKLEIQLRVSKQFLLLFGAIIISCALIILYLPIALILKIFLWLLTIGYSVPIFYRDILLRSPKSIKKIIMHYPDWSIQIGDQMHKVIVRGDSTVTSKLSILRFNTLEKKFKCSSIVFKDAMLADEYRQLLVRL